MTILETVIKAARPHTVIIGVAAVFCGSAAAAVHSNFEVLPAVLCLLFVICAQISGNLYQKYYQSVYSAHEITTMDARDRRVFERLALHEGAKIFLIMTATVGVAIMGMVGWWTLIIGIVIFVLFYFYNMGKHPLFRTPWSVLVTFLAFGPICTMGTSLVQSQHSTTFINILNWYDIEPSVFMGLISGFMAINYHIIGNIVRLREDLDYDNKTYVVVTGKEKALTTFFINGAIVFALGILAVKCDGTSLWWAYCITPLFAFITNTLIGGFALKASRERLVKLKICTGLNMLLMGLVSFILVMSIGTPTDDVFTYF